MAKNGRKSSANSIDLEIWGDDNKSVTLYAIKSGTKVFNAQSIARQKQAFVEAQKCLIGNPDGSINWKSITQYVSSKEKTIEIDNQIKQLKKEE